VALVAAAALVPAAALAAHRKHTRHVLRLSLVPLQTAQLGPAGAALPLEFDSGTISNQDVPPELKKDGRLNGYLLDYGDPYLGGAGVTSIQTQVERFRGSAGAKKGLKYWKLNDKFQGKVYRQIGIGSSSGFFKVRKVGSGRFAYFLLLQVPHADPIYLVDEAASSGSFILHATIEAGTESTAKQLAPVLMARLDHRLHQLLGGHLHGSPPPPPPFPEPGPPPGGPDLSKFVVGASDFTGPATVIDQGYGIDPTALSTYGVDLRPAGPFGEVLQSISWYRNVNETTWQGSLFAALFASVPSGNGITQVDLTGIGDNAFGVILTGTDQSGATVSQAFVIMWQGQAVDLAIAQSSGTIQASDVHSLAQAMASHLNAGLAGSRRSLGADDLDEPAPVALSIQLDEQHALPRPELQLPFPHRH
jgi:hypothetical protein